MNVRNKISDLVRYRVLSDTRDPDDIYNVFIDLGKTFVEDYNKKIKKTNLPQIQVGKKTRVSPSDESVYLTIEIKSPNTELFHVSDHPGESRSHCGAVHIKQLCSFNGIQLASPRCFQIINHPEDMNRLSLFLGSFSDDADFKILKLFIESISVNNVITLGYYTRLTPTLIRELQLSLQQSLDSPTRKSNVVNPNLSTEAQHGSPDRYSDSIQYDNYVVRDLGNDFTKETENEYEKEFPPLI